MVLWFFIIELSNSTNLKFIENILLKYEYNKLIVWKVCMVLSVFPLNESIILLDSIKSNYSEDIIISEVKRSLNLIKFYNS